MSGKRGPSGTIAGRSKADADRILENFARRVVESGDLHVTAPRARVLFESLGLTPEEARGFTLYIYKLPGVHPHDDEGVTVSEDWPRLVALRHWRMMGRTLHIDDALALVDMLPENWHELALPKRLRTWLTWVTTSVGAVLD